MDTSNDTFKIVFTNDCINEMDRIYNYIGNNLYSTKSEKKIMQKVEESIENLKYMPKSYGVIKRYPEIKLEYRRILINNYIIIYTVNERENTVYIVHMYYGRSDYLNKI